MFSILPSPFSLQLYTHSLYRFPHPPYSCQAERLRDFITPEWQEELFDYCYRMKRTSLEVLQVWHLCR